MYETHDDIPERRFETFNDLERKIFYFALLIQDTNIQVQELILGLKQIEGEFNDKEA